MAQRLPEQARGAADRGNWVWVPATPASGAVLGELLGDFRIRSRRIAAVFLSAAALAFVASFLLPIQYRSTVLLAPVSTQQPSAFGAIAGQLSGLAGLAGLSGTSAQGNQVAVTLATLQSRGFMVDFAKRRQLPGRLFPRRYDESSGQWKRRWWRFGGAPSDDEILQAMLDIVTVEQDPLSGLITLTVDSHSPESARGWAKSLVSDVNEKMRAVDVAEAERSIEYLNAQIGATTVSELRQNLFQLVKERTQTMMLAHVTAEYALRTVDPPSLTDRPAKPRRMLLGILAGVLAVVVYCGMILVRFALRPI